MDCINSIFFIWIILSVAIYSGYYVGLSTSNMPICICCTTWLFANCLCRFTSIIRYFQIISSRIFCWMIPCHTLQISKFIISKCFIFRPTTSKIISSYPYWLQFFSRLIIDIVFAFLQNRTQHRIW